MGGMGTNRDIMGVRKDRMIKWGRRQGWGEKRERVECAWRNVEQKKGGKKEARLQQRRQGWNGQKEERKVDKSEMAMNGETGTRNMASGGSHASGGSNINRLTH